MTEPQLALYCSQTERPRLQRLLLAVCMGQGFALSQVDNLRRAAQAVIVSLEQARTQLRNIIADCAHCPVLVIGPDSAADALWCLRNGATEYLLTETLEQEPDATAQLLRTLLGQVGDRPIMQSARSAETYRLARRVAPSNVPVFIQGPSGCGKEVLARFVHQHSLRADGPFVAVNCAAIPDNMLEATLFGHEKGAFTGADRRREGKFIQAAHGTLLLDEITEMPIELQAKLLRAIQEQEIEPLGVKAPLPTNVRIIATSNRNLKTAIDEGQLRLDLYYRLNVFPLTLAALSERLEDVLPLAELFARRHGFNADDDSGSDSIFDAPAQTALQRHDWPGNVRELENRIQRALILSEGSLLRASDLGLSELDSHADVEQGNRSFRERLDAKEDAMILQTLRAHDGQRKATANALGMSERTLRYRLSRMRDSGVRI